ncbi:MAG: WYL domain-containing protein [Burkholderiales bacterium]|nr:WYL domain-containing protein [Burkholderiales bacterium]
MPRKPESHQTLLRQWDMLRMIPRYPVKIAASDIVARLRDEGYEVTKRTVERDLVTLSESFPLLSDTKSMPFGWSWQQHAAPIDVPQLTPTQALAFVLMQEYLGTLLPGSVTSDLGPYFRMARQRLADVASGGAGRHWLERVRIIPPSQPLIAPKVAPAVHTAVTDALLKDCKLAITYRSRGAEKPRDAVVHPLGLVQRGALLYLVVVFDGYDDVRMVALHRISAAEVLPERAARPQGFDLAGYVQKGFMDFGSGRSIRLEALFEEDATIALAESPLCEDQVLGPPKGGMVRLTATVTETPQLVWWLLGFGGRVEVLKPAGLRAQMVEMARAMGARYEL